ncbi:hypothetical protein O6H91_05G081600 [Diphasiastrum complanatum]|uniref:Uncharacterized protein n=1 Tax=Diphasiastrum complanatum TaxID=34168 RepID=A0ACC2DQC8_DIPCM|nr:hypothetical protein O6H91_05G081600 [Diphasiastrum complanatum]
MECVVQGIIETQHVEALQVLLQGLCGGRQEKLKIHEICLKSGTNLGVEASEVHLLCSLSQTDPVWTVRHVGGPMRGAGAEQLPAHVRSVLESSISSNALRFFYALGYKMDYELVRIGYVFQFQRVVPITVTATMLCKVPKLHAIDEAIPVTPGIQLVELTAPASTENYSEAVGAISSFAEHLAPLIHLSKPGVPTGVVPTASTAAASLVSRGAMKVS